MKPEQINFYSENSFELVNTKKYSQWIVKVIERENKKLEELSYIFCDDDYLLDLNEKYLNHDTFTDIITFDYSVGNILQGDIYISTERVEENAASFGVSFDEELRRVIIHGVLHLSGYKDKTEAESILMRHKEEEMMQLFHVEQ